MAQSFRDLKVWNLAVDLAVDIYRLTCDFPKSEIYGLSSQMRRASVSIASNIAEGSARSTKRDFKQFLSVARGSNCELQTQLIIVQRLNLATLESISELEHKSHEIGRMLTGLQTTSPLKSPNRKTRELRTENL